MLRLKCPSQNYAWGRLARSDSEVAALTAAAGTKVDHEKPYAELWMGTHPSGAAVLAANTTISLQDWLEQHPQALGATVLQRFGLKLPFLFKVLSVETALSIQSHPDKELAERLHAEQPHVYKDNNHKPEMALAITDFEALCGFVSTQDLSEALLATPELTAVVGQQRADAIHNSCKSSTGAEAALRQAFTSLMTAEPNAVAEQVEILDDRLQQEHTLTPKEKLIMRLHQQYPHDVGVLAVFFLNLVVLKPGEAIYLAANEPHAYVSGQLIECMATSDNVIRAGLTPKLRDTRVLCESLTYNQGPPVMLQGDSVQEYTTLYSPPFDEFEVYKVSLPESANTIVPANKGPTLMLVMRGRGNVFATSALKDSALEQETGISKGDIFFVPSGTALDVAAGPSQDVELWIAACNSRLFAAEFVIPDGIANGHKAVNGLQLGSGLTASTDNVVVQSAIVV
ncbi:hypothetical protein ABBQ38_002533 [Trebouxia sp. C0009 RCD-2024]